MKHSIKRVQSQAGLSFAERKNVRPSVKQKLLFLLVLLLTATTGAWAQDAKHLITATSDKTRSLEQPLPYATTIGALYEAVTGQSFDDLISSMSAAEMPLTGISSRNTSVVSIGELNGASTPVTVNADGEATININFSGYVQAIFVSAISPLYAYVKDGVKDDYKWTAKVGEGQAQALPIGGLKGDGSETVTLQYTGRLKVKGVKATSDAAAPAVVNIVDLSTVTVATTIEDGYTVIGTLGENVKISIADKATVTLDGVTINGTNNQEYEWAGITCEGDATIILSGTNSVKGFYENYPGIYVPSGKTLTIQGEGSLTASPFDGGTDHSYGAGIGCGYLIGCGNINITGGNITAMGGDYAAGIGGGHNTSCGNIDITGGTINAMGGNKAAGIGSGDATYNKTASCGNITIANTVTKVTATKGSEAPNSIGKGKAANNATNTVGTVTIGGVVGAISESPYTYQPSN